MIDSKSRHRLAKALRHYLCNRMSNDDLDAVDLDWRDRGAWAVKEMAWQLYSDAHCHYAEGDFPRGSQLRGRGALDRISLF